MSANAPTLHILCGKIAAGKSTLAKQLAHSPESVLIAEDEWLSHLFADQMSSISDYVRCSGKLRSIMEKHIPRLLRAGTSVVLDFPANTVETRRWMLDLAEGSGVGHQLHLLDVADEVCLERMRKRNASGEHPFAVTEEQFHQITRHFVPPSADEGFNVIVHSEAD